MNTEFLDPFTLSWPEGVFPLGSDSLALGNFATVRQNWRVCDLGCGSGALLLLLKRREPSLFLFGIDSDPLSVQTAQSNLFENHLDGTIFTGDLRDRELPPGHFDLVISNPPYFPLHTGKVVIQPAVKKPVLWINCVLRQAALPKTVGALPFVTAQSD